MRERAAIALILCAFIAAALGHLLLAAWILACAGFFVVLGIARGIK